MADATSATVILLEESRPGQVGRLRFLALPCNRRNCSQAAIKFFGARNLFRFNVSIPAPPETCKHFPSTRAEAE